MAASFLNSPKAVQMSVYVVRAFVSFARAVSEYKELAAKISLLENKVGKHDKQLQHLFEAIKLLIAPPNLNHTLVFSSDVKFKIRRSQPACVSTPQSAAVLIL